MANIETAQPLLNETARIAKGEFWGLSDEKKTILEKGVKTVIFDLESTLTGSEALIFWGEMIGAGKEVKKITYAGLNGEKDSLPFDQSLKIRLGITKPSESMLKMADQENINKLTLNAVKTVNALVDAGINVVVITGGLDKTTESIQGVFRRPFYINKLSRNPHTDRYSAIADQEVLVRSGGKRILTQELIEKGIIKGPIGVVGDGVSDMGIDAQLKICFTGWLKWEDAIVKSDINVNYIPSVLPAFLGRKRRKIMRYGHYRDLLREGAFSLRSPETQYNDLNFGISLLSDLEKEYDSKTDDDRIIFINKNR